MAAAAPTRVDPLHDDPSSPAVLRVVSWNTEMLSGSHERLVRMAAHLRSLGPPDIVVLTELQDIDAIRGLTAELGDNYRYHFHDACGRSSGNLHLGLIFNADAVEGGKLDFARRFDTSDRWAVEEHDPYTHQPFLLRFRRGFLARLVLKQTGRPCVVCGIHLKSLRGNEFSHYKRMAQARVIRAVMQAHLDSDLLICGDFNSASTDPLTNPIREESLVAAARAAAAADRTRSNRYSGGGGGGGGGGGSSSSRARRERAHAA